MGPKGCLLPRDSTQGFLPFLSRFGSPTIRKMDVLKPSIKLANLRKLQRSIFCLATVAGFRGKVDGN